MRRGIAGIALSVLLAPAAGGCLGGIGDECRIDSECRAGLICYFPSHELLEEKTPTGTCRRPCMSDDDCDWGSVCVEGGACFRAGEIADADADADDGLDAPLDEPLADVPDGECELPAEFPYAFKMTEFSVGENGFSGSGLDMDRDPSTCAPGQDWADPLCSGGIDNGMAQLGVAGNPSLASAVESGAMNNLVVLTGYEDYDGESPFLVDFFVGVLELGEPGCAGGPECAYSVSESSFHLDTCLPVSSVSGARISGNSLTAGSEGDMYLFDAWVVGMHIVAPIHRPRLEATVSFSGGEPAGVEGIIGGVLKRDDFIGAFEAVSPEDYPNPPTKQDVIDMWNNMYDGGEFEMDFDLGGDTMPDASSIGFIFTAVPVSVSGIAPAE